MGLSDHRLRWPRPRRSFGPVCAHATSNVVPAMLSVASTHTEPKSSAIIAATGEKSGLAGDVVSVPQLDVARLAREGGKWRGTIDVAAFERLGDVLFGVADSGQTKASNVSAALDFSVDDEGWPRVRGVCNVVAPIRCSRCAETVDVEVESHLDFRVVGTEADVERLMPAFDALVSEDGRLPVTALVEDDILLSIPERCCAEASTCAYGSEADAYAGEAELAGHDAGMSEAKPLDGLRALVEGRQPA